DGKIALPDGKGVRLSNEEDLRRVHRLRAAADAILVGVGTVLKDDPKLTVKSEYAKGRNPLRVVLDSDGKIPDSAHVLDGSAPTMVPSSSTRWSGERVRVHRSSGTFSPLPAGVLGVASRRDASSAGRRHRVHVRRFPGPPPHGPWTTEGLESVAECRDRGTEIRCRRSIPDRGSRGDRYDGRDGRFGLPDLPDLRRVRFPRP